MGILSSFVWGVCLWIAFQIIRFIKADCDLSLQWCAKFGRKPAKLIGKVVWITGASSGIGEYLAYELAKAGCRLVLSARRRDQLERVKAQCLLSGPLTEDDVFVLPLDMTKFDTHHPAVTTVLDKFDRIDILVNNAGRGQRARFVDISLEVDRELYELNVLGPISLTRAVLPHMYKLKQGHIVVVSSVVTKLGYPNVASYASSKHALQGAFECLRLEAHKHKIKVTLLCPGPVYSNFLKVALTDKPGESLGLVVDPSDKTKMSVERCAFLCAAAIANRLDEAWISVKPTLALVYLAQYAPTYARRLLTTFGNKATALKDESG